MTDTEDDKLIERLARAACEAEGREFTWKFYANEARRHLAMQRELERARRESESYIRIQEIDDDGTVLVSGFATVSDKDTDQ